MRVQIITSPVPKEFDVILGKLPFRVYIAGENTVVEGLSTIGNIYLFVHTKVKSTVISESGLRRLVNTVYAGVAGQALADGEIRTMQTTYSSGLSVAVADAGPLGNVCIVHMAGDTVAELDTRALQMTIKRVASMKHTGELLSSSGSTVLRQHIRPTAVALLEGFVDTFIEKRVALSASTVEVGGSMNISTMGPRKLGDMDDDILADLDDLTMEQMNYFERS